MSIVIMGVAGCGKSTLGQVLAERLGHRFVEGDAYHPPSNQEKLVTGVPLTDSDRKPWLEALAVELREARAGGTDVVLACSALRRSYRDQLRAGDAEVLFVHLALDQATATHRVGARQGHLMPSSLVPSQFDALEPLTDDEPGLTLDATLPSQALVTQVAAFLQLAVTADAGQECEQSPRR